MKYDNETRGKVMNFVEKREQWHGVCVCVCGSERQKHFCIIINAKWWILKKRKKVIGNNTFQLNFIVGSSTFFSRSSLCVNVEGNFLNGIRWQWCWYFFNGKFFLNLFLFIFCVLSDPNRFVKKKILGKTVEWSTKDTNLTPNWQKCEINLLVEHLTWRLILLWSANTPLFIGEGMANLTLMEINWW